MNNYCYAWNNDIIWKHKKINKKAKYEFEFDEITVTFTNQSDRSLEIEDKVYLTLLINKLK